MKSLRFWLPTKLNTPMPPLALLDMGYIAVLLPLLVTLKAPMILFSVMVLAILFFKRSPANNMLVLFVFIMGILGIYLSLYGAFSFRGLSRLKLFLELLVYILLVVVAMQRLTQKINMYLLISPFLFLALSLFFYHSIAMLSYIIFEIFFLLWMILAHRMEGKLVDSFRASMVMFMYSLPWVVVLFIFFPRISFEHASYGFKGETIQRMGHDGTMFLDGNALLVPSDRIVMEVGFEGRIPPASALYFRGSILYYDKKDHWEALLYPERKNKAYYPTQGEKVHYKVTLYPTQKKWLYLLDMPSRQVIDSTLDRDLISTVKKNIDEPIHYAGSSSLSPYYEDTLDKITRKASSYFNKSQNPKTYTQAQKIKHSYDTQSQRASAVNKFFKTQVLTYTLTPDALDTNHTTDSFLFDKRRGYCVHFASSFVTMARMTGIPARIVTGYKSDRSESLNNYLSIKEKDAHAWAELYIDNRWVRYETTATASSIEGETQESLSQKSTHPLIKKINLYLMYIKYNIETWILYYSHIRQLQLLDYAKNNPQFVAGFVASLIAIILLSFTIVAYFRRPSYSSEALAILQPLLKQLKKHGYTRKESESMHQFLLRYHSQNPNHPHIKEIDTLYESILYQADNSKQKQLLLKKSVKKALN